MDENVNSEKMNILDPENHDEKDLKTQTGSDDGNFLTVNKRLLPVKLFYLFFFGGVGAVFPYITVFYKQLGLDPLRIGILGGIRPFVSFFSAFVWGAVADAYRIRKLALLMSVCAWMVLMTAMGFVPPADEAECPVAPSVVLAYLNASHNEGETLVGERLLTSEAMKSTAMHEYEQQVVRYEIINGRESKNRNKIFHTQLQVSKGVDLAMINTTKLREVDVAATIEMMMDESDTSWLFQPEGVLRIFIIFLALIVFGEFMQAPTFALGDTATLDCLDGDYDRYGQQRVWGSVGFGVCAFGVGALVDSTRTTYVKCGITMVFSNYRVAFCCYAVVVFMALIVASRLKFKEHDKDQKSDHDIMELMKTLCCICHVSVLLVMFFFGICNGAIFGFLFWHLENLGASQLLMGTSSLISPASEIIMFFLSYRVIALIGHINVLHLGLASFSIRFLIYAVIDNPWWVLPTEALQGVSYAAVWTALTSYLALAVPSDSFATIQGILHGVYWGLGFGVGNFLTGVLIEYYGAVNTFMGFSVASSVVLVLFVILQCICPKPEFLKKGYNKINGAVSAEKMEKD
ncbi:major facilitator superfamily domain-containing protein 6-like [Glandiceps talaboti]